MPKATAFSSNLLDFTSSTSNHDSQIRQAPLVPSVQPGRRGRPTREPSRSQLPSSKFPEMPQPPVLHHPKPPNVADNLASAAPLLQVTGEAKETQSSPKPPQNLDTFGMPSIPIATPKSEEGFEDSFGARVSRFGANLQRPSSGLDPSLRGIRSTSISASQPKSGLATSSSYNFPTSFEASKGISPAPTAKRTLDPSSSIPDGELSFETRFPSIEALSSGDAFSPPLPTAAPTSRPQSNQPQTLISPITCPPTKRPKSGPRQQSIMGSLTGGETLSDHQASSSKADRAPQPHSTHVTGTAFKSIQGGMLSPPTAQSQTGYFDLTSQNGRASPATAAGATKSPMPQDLMTGDESGELLMASMRPAMSTMTSANGIRLRPKSMGQPPASGSQSGESRPLLAHVNSSKSNDNTQPQRPPLKGMQVEEIVTSPDAKSPEKVKPDSSDEEAGPESASAIYRRPDFPSQGASALPAADGKWAAPKAGQSGKEKERSPSKLPSKAATTPLPVENSKERPAARRLPTTERNRPQSMYVTTTSGPSQSGTDASVPQSAEPQRPSHGRQGSITDMVSRFESMNSPVTPTANGSSNGLSRKPWVAAKPAALRKLTTEVISQSPSFMLPKKIEGPVTVAPKPVQYGQTPAPAGFSRSSSGRSFPITMPTPSAKPSVSATADHVEPNAAVRRNDPKSPKSSEAQDSPEKQQPVNLLIQRWNRGGMSKPQSQPKRGNYV